jgi:hypothetical protein
VIFVKKTMSIIALLIIALVLPVIHAQQPQIPSLQVPNPTKVEAKALVYIDARQDLLSAGTFKVSGSAFYDTTTPYPVGNFVIEVDMSDSIHGAIISTSIDQITTTGKHTPTVYLSGRCDVKADKEYTGCHYWLMMTDNRPGNNKTAEIIGFLVFDRQGNRISYGTGPVAEGSIYVAPNGY